MTVLNTALHSLEDHLPKVIGPRTHGFIDYAHSALFFTAGALFWNRNRRASVAALAAGAFLLVESLLTEYPLGVADVISFGTHGEIDTGFVGAALAAPRLLGISDDPEAWFFRANGIAEAFVVGMTDFDSRRARLEKLDRPPRFEDSSERKFRRGTAA